MRHGASDGEHQRKRMLGNADGVPARRIHHEDAVMGGRVHVHVVHAHAGAAHDAKLGGLLEQRGRHFRGTANHQAVGIDDLGGNIGGRRSENFPARFTKQRNSTFTYFVGDNNFHRNSRLTIARTRVKSGHEVFG